MQRNANELLAMAVSVTRATDDGSEDVAAIRRPPVSLAAHLNEHRTSGRQEIKT